MNDPDTDELIARIETLEIDSHPSERFSELLRQVGRLEERVSRLERRSWERATR